MDIKNKKTMFVYGIIFLILVVIILFFIFKDKIFAPTENHDSPNSNVTRLAQESNILGNSENLKEVNNRIDNVISNSINKPQASEEEIASFSTKLSGSTKNRLTNIQITCKKLDGTILSNNETFSFEKIVGPSTEEEGYKEATVILNGEKVQALGGGNCQISSTLYNAVLLVPDLEVIERHEHGREVSYVPKGKDAAVAYGSIDFKFKNNTGSNLKLYFSTDDVNLSVRIVKLV